MGSLNINKIILFWLKRLMEHTFKNKRENADDIQLALRERVKGAYSGESCQ